MRGTTNGSARSPRGTRVLRALLIVGSGSVLGFLGACRTGGGLGLFQASPHERYVESLRSADLVDTELGRVWMAASVTSVSRAPRAELPYREIGYFDPARPDAVAFAVALPTGQRLDVSVNPSGPDGWFLDLLQEDDGAWEVVASAEESLGLSHRIEGPELLVVRLQPELLRGGRYEIVLQGRGSLAFPVQGADRRNVGSRYGDPRNGGSRSHRGIDIFAPRGTPALAAAEGRITRVGTNRLGGNVVHMRSSDDLSFYYAHLDRQTVGTGARVRAGEKLGEVGNTGNARSTPPHLHFAVFRGGEAVDPWGYLVDLGAGKPAVEAPTERLGDWIRTATAGLRLRGGPGTSFSVLDELPGQYPLRVDAAVRNWFRVETAAGRAGFVAAWLTAELDPPLARRVIAEPLEVLAEPSPGAPEIARFSEGVSLSIQARAGALDLVLGPENVRGWVRAR